MPLEAPAPPGSVEELREHSVVQHLLSAQAFWVTVALLIMCCVMSVMQPQAFASAETIRRAIAESVKKNAGAVQVNDVRSLGERLDLVATLIRAEFGTMRYWMCFCHDGPKMAWATRSTMSMSKPASWPSGVR